MRLLNLSFEDPAWQLACDEAMLDWCETQENTELLRLWEPAQPFVVLGVGNRAAAEADLAACAARGVPVLRRCSGGGAVLQAPGCLNFSLVLRLPEGEDLRDIQATHERVLARHEILLKGLLAETVDIAGTSDLVLNALKFSGNAQRRKLKCVLYHGTFLLRVDWDLMEAVLRMPSRQPDYRGSRSHREFLTTLPLSSEALSQALIREWAATSPIRNFPQQNVDRLAREKYSQAEWNLRL